MIKQTKWRSLTAVGISPSFWVQTRLIKQNYVDMNSCKLTLVKRQVKQYSHYEIRKNILAGMSQRALVNHYFGSKNCACLHWAQTVTVRSQDLRYKLKVHATTCIGLAIHHTSPNQKKCMSSYTAISHRITRQCQQRKGRAGESQAEERSMITHIEHHTSNNKYNRDTEMQTSKVRRLVH